MVVEDIEMIRGNQNFNPLIFLPPAMFDMIATSLMYLGLELTSVSSFQMLRGKFNYICTLERRILSIIDPSFQDL